MPGIIDFRVWAKRDAPLPQSIPVRCRPAARRTPQERRG
jgi:hypothetical protein